MKIKLQNTSVWHRWFAWHPVTVENTFVWLSYVERKAFECWAGPDFEYRLIKETK